MPKCRLLRIRCNEQEDYTGRDHPFITANGKVMWGPIGMEKEQTRDIQRDYHFQRRVKLRLFEQDDYDPNDYLGEHEVNRKDIGQGEQELIFAEDGANYSLWIEVFADPGR